MLTLAISTTTSQTEIALVQGRRILFEKKWKSNFNEAEKLIPQIRRALQEKYLPQAIFVVSGPGNFSALRIGVTIANTLAYAYSIPVFSLSTFEYLRRKVPSALRPKTAVVLRAGGNFVALLEPGKKKPNIISSDHFRAMKFSHIISDFKGSAKEFSLAQVTREYLKEKPRPGRMVKPRYLKPPTITQSKKPVFKTAS